MPPSEPAASGPGDEADPSAAGEAPTAADYPGAPRVIPRAEHGISRRRIDDNALKVLYRLNAAGHSAHLVGGGVRDLLLGGEPKDFDVATDAEPEEVRALFRNCRLIGRRFRLAHILFGRDVIEVATFRAGHPAPDDDVEAEDDGPADGQVHEDGRILRDNVFGTIEDDAFRRDFTINALYYDINGHVLVDYTGAMEDLAAGRLRLIGDPAARYREDPVRMLRAARFAAKLGFGLDPETAAPIAELGPLLRDIPPSRLFDEVLKLFQGGHAVASLEALRGYDLLQYLFPHADAALKRGDEPFRRLIGEVLANTDRRIGEGKPVTPAFIYAAFLWPGLIETAGRLCDEGEPLVMAFQRGGARVIDEQQGHTTLPRRFAGPARDIWVLQPKLELYKGRRAQRLLGHPRLRAAWDFLCLRRAAGEDVGAACDWWQAAMAEAPADAGNDDGASASAGARGRGRGRRRGGRRGGRSGNGDGAAS